MAFAPVYMKESDLYLGTEAEGTDFAIQLTSITLTPDAAVERFNTLKREGKYAEVGDPEWNLELGYAVGVNNAATPADVILADYLLEHHGEEVPFTFRPVSGGEGYSGTVRLVVGGVGGDQGSFATQSVTLPVIGQPEKVAAPVPAG